MSVLIVFIILSLFSMAVKDRLKTDTMAVYFAALMLSVDILYFAALADFLRPAALLVFGVLGGVSAAGVFTAARQKKSLTNRQKPDIYFTLHNISCVVFALIFSVKKPALYYWDELNLWGPSAKAVKLFDRLYSIGINPSTNDRNYPPGNAILNYFFSFFDSEYREYVLLLSYAFLFLACFAVGAWAVYRMTGSHTLGIGSYFVFMVSPFIAGNHLPLPDYSTLSYAYGTTMVDFNLAAVFLGILALYFAEKDRKLFLLPMIYMVTIKKNGIFFALLAFCVIACFELFTFKEKGWKLKKALVNTVLAVAVAAIAYGAWPLHLEAYSTPRREKIYDLTDTAAQPEIQVKTVENAVDGTEKVEEPVKKRVKPSQTSIKAIFIPSLRTERYNEILDEMKWYFVHNKEVIFCTDTVLIAVLFILGTVAAFCAPKGRKLAVLLASGGLTAGCFVYNLVIGYQMQFYNDMMVEYPRYMLSYYFGWIYLIILLFVASKGVDTRAKNILLTALLAASLFSIYHTGLDYTVFDAPQNRAQWAQSVATDADRLKTVLNEDDVVYLLCEDQVVLPYIAYRYNLMPVLSGIDTLSTGIDFFINFREKIDYTSDRQYYHVASPEKFTDVMNTYFDYIYVVHADDDFHKSYSKLFSDGLTQGTLYKVTTGEIPMQAVIL